jgi:hypothetical protein
MQSYHDGDWPTPDRPSALDGNIAPSEAAAAHRLPAVVGKDRFTKRSGKTTGTAPNSTASFGSIGCLTFSKPVPSQAGQTISVETSRFFFITNECRVSFASP